MQKISREEFQKRLDQINELFASIVAHAQISPPSAVPTKTASTSVPLTLGAATSESRSPKVGSRCAPETTSSTIAKPGNLE